MGQDSPFLILVMLGASAGVAKWWWDDYQAARSGTPAARPLPGAVPVPATTMLIAAVGALVLLLAETWGEYRLGLVTQQSRITVLFGLYTLAAAFVEELIFRGYVVVTDRGTTALWSGILAASVLFALLHPFLWDWHEGRLFFHATTKAWFSTGAIFAGSLWFYVVRFWSLNPARSLWPCIAAHAAKNLGVLLIKASQGYVSGWW